MKYRLLYILFIFLTGSILAQAQEVIQEPDSVVYTDVTPIPAILPPDSLQINDEEGILPLLSDSLTLGNDSIQALTQDTVPRKSNALDAPVYYEATDSIIMTAGNWAYLFGDSDVKYQQIELQSEIIEMSLDSSIVFAKFGIDSTGVEFGHPLFIDGDQQYESKTMRYSFNSRRGYITDVITQQGEGYVTSQQTKKMEDDVLYMVDGRYTTCDHHEHPHFYIHMTKAKVKPKKNIVTGPVYLVIEDVPLPIGLPFAFFPFSESYSSGVLFPSFGDESARGFFLREGGYYFAINDYVDLALRGDIYTKGSWGLSARSAYRKRYKFSGNFDTKYVVTKTGDKGLPDYSLSKDFMVTWTHSQDAKANPYRTFSANVNYRTSSYNRNETNELFNSSSTNNNKSSSISISQRFPTLPLSLSATMSINQTARDSTIAVTFPDLTATISRIYPFKRKQRIGKERWYEKIGFNYTGVLRNSITTKENEIFQKNIIKDWNNAIQHTIPVSATFSLLKYINISPSFNYTERWYTSKIEQGYDVQTNSLVARDTTYSFYRIYNYSASVQASTTLYGMYEPMSFIPYFGKKFKVIRHMFTPSVTYSMTPDFGSNRFGYYNTIRYINSSGAEVENTYSPFSHNMYGVPGRGKSGSISVSLDNNIEAKIHSAKDSTGERKISLIDRLNLSMNYNLAADSFNWSDLSTQLRIKLPTNYTINLNLTWDTYTYRYNESSNTLTRVNVPRWKAGKGFGRLRSTGTSFSYTFNNDTFKKWFGGKEGSTAPTPDSNDPTNQLDPMDPNHMEDHDHSDEDGPPGQRGRMREAKGSDDSERDSDGYYLNTFPWSFSVNYSVNLAYDYQKIDIKNQEYKYKLTHALSFNGSLQPTKNWRMNFNATYDFDHKKISYLTCSITRNMHCFNMTASVIPVGNYKSYSFTIAVSSQLLRDLKYDKHSNYRDGQTWY